LRLQARRACDSVYATAIANGGRRHEKVQATGNDRCADATSNYWGKK
jgi:hypothetical protein